MSNVVTLTDIQNLLGLKLVTNAYVSEQDDYAEFVDMYRKYYAGDHDSNLTSQMKNMLRISRAGNEFTGNYCQMVVDAMVDRLSVETVQGENDAATQWANEVRKQNRFDELQIDVHEAELVDGTTYVMVSWNEQGYVQIDHEPAFDGEEGMLAVYDRRGKTLLAAVKVWYETDDSGEDVGRVNVYEATQITKYSLKDVTSDDGKTTTRVQERLGEPEPWALGKIPVVPFKNRSQRRTTTGISELVSVVPLQDALNRSMVSMIMTSEVTAFPIDIAKGWVSPAERTPGMVIEIPLPPAADEQMQAQLLSAMDAIRLPQASIVPFIDQNRYLIDQITTITRTPVPEHMGGSTSSGEALKQREIGFLGKLRRFQVRTGNAWEDVFMLAQEVQRVFGSGSPANNTRYTCLWQEAELRNDKEVVENATKVRPEVSRRQYLEMIAPVYGWDKKALDDIVNEKDKEDDKQMGMAFNAMNSSRIQPPPLETEQPAVPEPLAQAA